MVSYFSIFLLACLPVCSLMIFFFFVPLLGLSTLYTRLVGGRAGGENPQDLAYVGPQDQVVSPGFVTTQIVDAYNEVRPSCSCEFFLLS